jgi:hypothetical protein
MAPSNFLEDRMLICATIETSVLQVGCSLFETLHSSGGEREAVFGVPQSLFLEERGADLEGKFRYFWRAGRPILNASSTRLEDSDAVS